MDSKALYAEMLRIRKFEALLLDLFSKGHLRGTVHTCLGQEACAVGVAGSLDRERDSICSNHRGHGHYLAFGGDMTKLLAEIIGRPDGVCGGIGGSQHLHIRNFYSNGILGGMVPVATGIALAHKKDSSKGVSVVFSGDGAMAEGSIGEAMNIAALWKLPILFVIEHNHIAQSTPWELEHSASLELRPSAFGIPVTKISGDDVSEVRKTTLNIIHEIREKCSPHCLLLDTVRLGPHSKGDDPRSASQLAKIRERDPLTLLKATLDKAIVEKIETDCDNEISSMLTALRIG